MTPFATSNLDHQTCRNPMPLEELFVHIRSHASMTLALDDIEETKAICEAFTRCQIEAHIASCRVEVGSEEQSRVSKDLLAIVLPKEGVVLDREGNQGWDAILRRWHGKVIHCFPDLKRERLKVGVVKTENLPSVLSVGPSNQDAFDEFVTLASSFLQASWLTRDTPKPSSVLHKCARL